MSHPNNVPNSDKFRPIVEEFLASGANADYLIDFAANSRNEFASNVSQVANAMLHRAVRSGDVRPLNAFLKRFASVKGSRIDIATIFRSYLAGIDNIREIMQYRKGEYIVLPGTSLMREAFELPSLGTDIFTGAKREIDALKKPKTEAKLAHEAANHLRNALKCCEELRISDTNAVQLLRMKLQHIAANAPKED